MIFYINQPLRQESRSLIQLLLYWGIQKQFVYKSPKEHQILDNATNAAPPE